MRVNGLRAAGANFFRTRLCEATLYGNARRLRLRSTERGRSKWLAQGFLGILTGFRLDGSRAACDGAHMAQPTDLQRSATGSDNDFRVLEFECG